MGGKKDKKKKSKDPLKKAALAAKKEAKADKAALKRMQKEQDRLNSLSIHDSDNEDGGDGKSKKKKSSSSSSSSSSKKNSSNANANDDLDSILESYRNRTKELNTAVLEPLEDESPFPTPPRGNFTWTLCPSNGMFYMFGGEYYDGVENLVFDELLRWDPDAKQQSDKDDDDDDDGNSNNKSNSSTNTGQWTRILTPPPHPPPRCAHTTVHHADALYVFGGECATADQYHHYRDLWKFDIKTNTWEEIRPRGGGTPPHARSGHRSVVWRHYMILFGGFHEALRSETRWFNDVHIFDFQSCMWTELKYGKLARLPPPRSACNVAVGSSPTEALYVTGGYSKVKNAKMATATNPGSKSEGIMHIDCWMLPLKSLLGNSSGSSGKGGGGLNGTSPPSWERITRKGEYPSARAGTSCVPHKNKLLVFGGVMDNEGDHHRVQSVFYDDLFALDMERRRWFAMRLKKNASGGGKRRRRKKVDGNNEAESKNNTQDDNSDDGGDDEEEDLEEDEDIATKNEEAISSGWGLDQLRHDMFAFIDGDGNVVYEKIEEENENVEDENGGKGPSTEDGESEMAIKPTDTTQPTDTASDGSEASEGQSDQAKQSNPTSQASSSSTPATPAASVSKPNEKIVASSVMKVDAKGLPTAVARQTPLPRINCATVIRNNTLYIYGGVLEVGDREVTLDDCWSIDLNKRDKWTCIWPGQMHRQVWKGVDSDNDSYISSDQGGDNDDSDDDMMPFEPIMEGGDPDQDEEGSMDEEARKKAKKAAKKAKEKEKRRGIRHEIAELKEKLGVDNEQRTPLMGESMADFYARTTEYWNVEAATKRINLEEEGQSSGTADAQTQNMTVKERKREGFQLAKERYEELKPIMDRLNELESAQMESEEKKAMKKEKKKPKKDRMR